MNCKFLFTALALIVSIPWGYSHAASNVDQCPAKNYRFCSSFMTSVEIGEHEAIIDNHLAGFTRSIGEWKISVRYQPEVECAKVKILLDMGPIDSVREYERAFRSGGGVISDSGSFMHRIDDLDSALRILHSSCRVPDSATPKQDAKTEKVGTSQDDLERLALEEERERLALQAEQEEQDLVEERERLALEQERLSLEEDLRAARERRRLEQERERQRRLAEQQRERERQRLREAEAGQQSDLDEQLAEINALLERRIQQELEERARKRAQQQQSIDAGLQTFFGILQGAAELHQHSVGVGDGPSTSDPGVGIIQDDPISPCQRDYRLCESSGRSGAIN